MQPVLSILPFVLLPSYINSQYRTYCTIFQVATEFCSYFFMLLQVSDNSDKHPGYRSRITEALLYTDYINQLLLVGLYSKNIWLQSEAT